MSATKKPTKLTKAEAEAAAFACRYHVEAEGVEGGTLCDDQRELGLLTSAARKLDSLALRRGLRQDEDEREHSICRQCSECDGQHHWMWLGKHLQLPDDDGDLGPAVMECKHCDAIRKMTDEDTDV